VLVSVLDDVTEADVDVMLEVPDSWVLVDPRDVDPKGDVGPSGVESEFEVRVMDSVV